MPLMIPHRRAVLLLHLQQPAIFPKIYSTPGKGCSQSCPLGHALMSRPLGFQEGVRHQVHANALLQGGGVLGGIVAYIGRHSWGRLPMFTKSPP